MKIDMEKRGGMFQLTAVDNGRAVATGGGPTIKEAASWLVYHVNRITEQVEEAIEDAGFLSSDEIDGASQCANQNTRTLKTEESR